MGNNEWARRRVAEIRELKALLIEARFYLPDYETELRKRIAKALEE